MRTFTDILQLLSSTNFLPRDRHREKCRSNLDIRLVHLRRFYATYKTISVKSSDFLCEKGKRDKRVSAAHYYLVTSPPLARINATSGLQALTSF